MNTTPNAPFEGQTPTPLQLARQALSMTALLTFVAFVYLFVSKGNPTEDSWYNGFFTNQTQEVIGFLAGPLLYFLTNFRRR